MTAIAGIIRLDDQAVDQATIQRMQGVLAQYGRDAQHHWLHGQAGLLRTLLRITPEDSLDRQPRYLSQHDKVVLFDGRLDNRTELAFELGLSNAELALMADSEVVLHACVKWDDRAVEFMLGDFAIACWSPLCKSLWLARDPIGQRPLFWHRQSGFFAFATLPKALFAIPGVARAIHEERLADVLALLPMQGPDTLFKDVYRVEPGQLVMLDDGRLSTRRYHSFDPEREIHFPNDDDYLAAFSEQLEHAVSRRLRSAGPIASHLSSGYDSGTVTAIAARQLAEQGRRLTAYTAVPREGFEGPETRDRHADEGPGARALAARFANIDHVLIRPDGRSPLDNLQSDTEDLDRIVTNPCNMVWVDAIHADAARRGVKVLLTGQMGNMSISHAGLQLLPVLFRRGQFFKWWHELAAVKRTHSERRWVGLLANSIGPYLPGPLWSLISDRFGHTAKLTDYSAIHPDFERRIDCDARARAAAWDLHYRPWADSRRMRIAVLGRIDTAEHSAAANVAGLELRDPTSDRRLFEFCLAVPDSQFLRNGQTRWLLHRLMDDVLPSEIVNAKTKGLQAADWYEGVGNDLPRLRETFDRMLAHDRVGDYLDLETMQDLLANWPEQGFANGRVMRAYRLKLLRGIAVGTFIRYVEQDNR